MADLKEVDKKIDIKSTYPICIVCHQNIQSKFEFLACGGPDAVICHMCQQQIKRCPLCRADLLGHIISGFVKKLLLDNLASNTYICPNKSCDTKLSFAQYQKHIDTCGFTHLDCKNIGCTGYFSKDVNHYLVCDYRSEKCNICHDNIIFHKLKMHTQVCPKKKVTCPNNKCIHKCEYRFLAKHQEKCWYRIYDCQNKNYGCNFSADFFGYDKHKKECEYIPYRCLCTALIDNKQIDEHKKICPLTKVQCENKCGQSIMIKNRDSHKLVCTKEIILCENKCGSSFVREKVLEHNLECPEFKLSCDNMCGESFTRKNSKIHLETCKNVLIPCIYGCKITEKRGDMKNHFNTCSEVYTMCQNQNCFAQFKNGDAKEHKCGSKNPNIELDNKYVTIKHGVTIDCMDDTNVWYEGRIMKIEEKRFLIKFTNWKFFVNDEWFNIDDDKFTVHRTVTQWGLYIGRKILLSTIYDGSFYHNIKNIDGDTVYIVRTLDNAQSHVTLDDCSFTSLYLTVPNITTGMICQVFPVNKWITVKINNITVNEITYTIINGASDLLLNHDDGSLNYAVVCGDPNRYFKLVGYRSLYENNFISDDDDDGNN
jgi:hypothetical protein